jgi:hypothetical protein
MGNLFAFIAVAGHRPGRAVSGGAEVLEGEELMVEALHFAAVRFSGVALT